MEILKFETGMILTNSYLLIDETSLNCVLIDAAMDSTDSIISVLQKSNLKLISILLTHSHWDHTADALDIKLKTGAKVYINQDDSYRILNPMKHSIFPLPFELKPVKPDGYLSEGDIIKFGESELEVFTTPGHTEGSVIFICHKDKIIFSGDTLFKNSIGRTDLPGGSMNRILNSIHNKIMTLPYDYILYPGHGEKSTIRAEREYNPFLIDMSY